jgi:predicted nucleic acid-binding protein
MKTILVDLNVLLDFLFKRENYESAEIIVDMCDSKEVKGFLCSHEITTLSYFLEKRSKDKIKNKFVVGEILDIFDILCSDKTTLKNALASGVDDFEDAVIVESCKENNIDFIVTRNIKDFKASGMKVLLPEDFIVGIA